MLWLLFYLLYVPNAEKSYVRKAVIVQEFLIWIFFSNLGIWAQHSYQFFAITCELPHVLVSNFVA